MARSRASPRGVGAKAGRQGQAGREQWYPIPNRASPLADTVSCRIPCRAWYHAHTSRIGYRAAHPTRLACREASSRFVSGVHKRITAAAAVGSPAADDRAERAENTIAGMSAPGLSRVDHAAAANRVEAVDPVLAQPSFPICAADNGRVAQPLSEGRGGACATAAAAVDAHAAVSPPSAAPIESAAQPVVEARHPSLCAALPRLVLHCLASYRLASHGYTHCAVMLRTASGRNRDAAAGGPRRRRS